jgi:hypothetical protein
LAGNRNRKKVKKKIYKDRAEDEEMRNAHNILAGKHHGKVPLGLDLMV